jgi:hypothetical protein
LNDAQYQSENHASVPVVQLGESLLIAPLKPNQQVAVALR